MMSDRWISFKSSTIHIMDGPSIHIVRKAGQYQLHVEQNFLANQWIQGVYES